MKRTVISVIILIVAFVAVMLAGAWANDCAINFDSGDGIEYVFYSLIFVILSLCAACFFKTNRRRCALFLVSSWILPLVAGITTFVVAAFFCSLIVVTADDAVLGWFKGIAEPDKGCKLDETDE